MKNYIYFFLLTASIVIKISSMALHMYVDHEDDLSEENCELCIDAIKNQNLESFTATDSPILLVCFSNYSDPLNSYKSVVKNPSLDNALFGRPPPQRV